MPPVSIDPRHSVGHGTPRDGGIVFHSPSQRKAKGKPKFGIIREPASEIPVIGEYDLCVLGGSCTGLFAAVRAARLGLSVAIVERMGSFGGVATLSLVNVWHSPLDETFERQIFSGLSIELMERLKRRGAVHEAPRSPSWAWAFNPSEMKIELDELVVEHGIAPWLHTSFTKAIVEKERITAVLVENKSGRGAIRARFFIDATGDGDLCHRMGLETYEAEHRQPSTTCALFDGWETLKGADWQDIVRRSGPEFSLPEGFAWGAFVPGSKLYMLAATRIYENCSDAEGFARAEIEGRRQIRAIQDILRREIPGSQLALGSLPARIGIRQTRHVRCMHQLRGGEVLGGCRFPDAIANGSYRVDVHHDDKPGLTFRYLDGREAYLRPGFPREEGRWRPLTSENPTFYQIPYRCLVPKVAQGKTVENLLAAGRFIDADQEAHAAIRVMVNMNQTGEAAGVAAWLALRHNQPAAGIDITLLRKTLADGGSLII